MQLHTTVSFDAEETEVFVRALRGHDHAFVEKPRSKKEERHLPLRSLLNRVTQHEPLGDDTLSEFDTLLRDLMMLYQPETTAAYWRNLGAPGGDDAIEGLALERRETIRRIGECRVLVELARDLIRRIDGVAAHMGREGVAAVMSG